MQNAATTSMPAAAFAVAHGCGRPRLEQLSPGRFKFVFEDDRDGKTSRLILAYFNGETASACEFYKALQSLRAVVNVTKHGGAR
jgi:hypothetical protein